MPYQEPSRVVASPTSFGAFLFPKTYRMANRFLDTNFYKSPFVRSLKGPLKSLYCFFICDCDGAGIWNYDLEAASMFTGFEITDVEFHQNFVSTGKAVDIGRAKYFFPDFIEHQYPGGLQSNNKAHKNFIITLKKFDLVDENLAVKKKPVKKELQSSFQAPKKPPYMPPMSSNGNGNGQVIKGKQMSKEDFILFQSQLIQDTAFIEGVMMTRGVKSLAVMLDWIKVFNVHIAGEGKLEKDYEEYRRHFKNWINLQDTTKAPPIVQAIQTGSNGTLKVVTEDSLSKYRK